MQPIRKANVALWTAQVLLAALFVFAGASKLAMPLDQLAKLSPLPALFLKFIGVAEITGALGLILPWSLKIRPALTPLAASGLVIIMMGATVITLATAPAAFAVVPFVAGLIAASVAYGRGRPVLQRVRAERRGD